MQVYLLELHLQPPNHKMWSDQGTIWRSLLALIELVLACCTESRLFLSQPPSHTRLLLCLTWAEAHANAFIRDAIRPFLRYSNVAMLGVGLHEHDSYRTWRNPTSLFVPVTAFQHVALR